MSNHYSQEFKDQIVELHRSRGRTFMELGREFNLSATTVSNWVRAAQKEERSARERPVQEDQSAKIARLEKELARKEEELEILGKALAFFARKQDQ